MLKKSLLAFAVLLTSLYNYGQTKAVKNVAASADISASGWRLWPDREAQWKDDDIYLPSEVNLSKMKVNAPTGGWQALNDKQGINITLPSTVEEHYWGKFGRRPYTKNEAQRGAGTSFGNGNYLGVSWWWRSIQVPQFKPGQRVLVWFRGARLRSEVYCNGKLCGYTIMGELPFQADITDAVKPGEKTQLAVRITNPGGHLDWIDFAQMRIQWGKYFLPPSHGFGGLDNNIELSVRDNVSVTDLAAINKPDLHQVHLVAEVGSNSKAYNGPVKFNILYKGQTVWSGSKTVNINAGQTKKVEIDAQVNSAQPWQLNSPVLYQAQATLTGLSASNRKVNFGFRYMTAQGIGTDAKLVFNHKRIVPVSSISWGYWGRNGLWPDAEMANREVVNAKKMGLNCLQFHRNIGKPAVLDVQDKLGLLRCEEPGGGKFAIGARYSKGPYGPNGEFLASDEKLLDAFKPMPDYVQPDTVNTSGAGPDGDGVTFWEKYEEEKILEMVKRDRSHPSLIMYTVQNESSELDLRNPRIYRLFREMHELDPSRIIAFYSGGDPKNAQVLMLPYHNDISYAGTKNPYAGWQDIHTCGGPCNYLDFLYKDPENYRQHQKAAAHTSINMWGEMLGAATPDNYEQLAHSFDKKNPDGYEKEDAAQVLNGYHSFIDKWGFRKAFPTDSSLFTAIGYRTYYFWKKMVEQSRIDNNNDYLVISGWESTTIDNHSGLVDNHRFLKGDPKEIAAATKPEMLVIEPHHMIVSKGDKDVVDVYLVNETNRTGAYTLKLTVNRPNGSIAYQTEKNVTAKGGDTYGQLLADNIEFKADASGMMKIEGVITAKKTGIKPLTGSDEISVVDVASAPVMKNIALIESGDELAHTLKDEWYVDPKKLSDVPASQHLDAIVLSTKLAINDLFKSTPPVANAPVSQNLVPEGQAASGQAKTVAAAVQTQSGISVAEFDEALKRVKNDGTRLVLWPDNDRGADAFAKELAKRNIVKYTGKVGNLGAPWFGSWFFVRKHWLLNGLPTDCAMDWRYGISAFGGPEWLKDSPKGTNTDGLMLDGEGMETVIGYGADHNPKVGMSGVVIPYGKGQIVLYCLPQLVLSLQEKGDFAINRTICKRLLANSLQVK
ncbi:MAG: sugar-binding domain-containing protein [Bacteroidota bacterium]